MSLTLTSCTRVREPGFSPSECLELAKRIEVGELQVGDWQDEIPDQQKSMIVAALRAYADA